MAKPKKTQEEGVVEEVAEEIKIELAPVVEPKPVINTWAKGKYYEDLLRGGK